jgi:hypothetical protein
MDGEYGNVSDTDLGEDIRGVMPNAEAAVALGDGPPLPDASGKFLQLLHRQFNPQCTSF